MPNARNKGYKYVFLGDINNTYASMTTQEVVFNHDNTKCEVRILYC
jgi:hypothetical protein